MKASLLALAHCDDISHYFQGFNEANNQWIDWENNQQICPEWKESSVSVWYEIVQKELQLDQQQENPAAVHMMLYDVMCFCVCS